MKIQIETFLMAKSTIDLIQFNAILIIAKDCETLENLKARLDMIGISEYKYGFGSNHCWVKQIGVNGTLSDDRLLYITQ
jgi:hypothetical protein